MIADVEINQVTGFMVNYLENKLLSRVKHIKETPLLIDPKAVFKKEK